MQSSYFLWDSDSGPKNLDSDDPTQTLYDLLHARHTDCVLKNDCSNYVCGNEVA